MSRALQWDPSPALSRHLEALVGERSPAGSGAGLRRAEEYVRRVLEEAGLVVLKEPIGPAHDRWSNIIGDLPAAVPGAAPLIILGGHIDAVDGSPGADDNASGAAAMLALAGYFAGREDPGRRVTLRFAGFNLEEWGMVGSQVHADTLHRAGRQVEGMISLEMIGYVDPGGGRQKYPPGIGIGRRKSADFISVVGDRRSGDLARGVAGSLARVPGLPVESVTLPGPLALLIGASLSDHSSFWRHGMPAVMVGDTAFYRNPHYHAPTDRLETLSMPFLARVTRGLALYLETALSAGPEPGRR